MNQCCHPGCEKEATNRIYNGLNKNDPYDYTDMCDEHTPDYTCPDDRVEPLPQEKK